MLPNIGSGVTCNDVASNDGCTIDEAAPGLGGQQRWAGHEFRIRRACPVACATPCLDSPTPISADNTGVAGTGVHTSWTCTQYADYYQVTNGNCSLAAIKASPNCQSDAACADEPNIAWIWWMCPNKCGARCVGSTCPSPPAPASATIAAPALMLAGAATLAIAF